MSGSVKFGLRNSGDKGDNGETGGAAPDAPPARRVGRRSTRGPAGWDGSQPLAAGCRRARKDSWDRLQARQASASHRSCSSLVARHLPSVVVGGPFAVPDRGPVLGLVALRFLVGGEVRGHQLVGVGCRRVNDQTSGQARTCRGMESRAVAPRDVVATAARNAEPLRGRAGRSTSQPLAEEPGQGIGLGQLRERWRRGGVQKVPRVDDGNSCVLWSFCRGLPFRDFEIAHCGVDEGSPVRSVPWSGGV